MKKCGCFRDGIPGNTTAKAGNMRHQDNDKLAASYEQSKSAAELLYESELKYKLLIDNMTDIVWIIDINGNITFINDEVETILGYKREAILGNPIYDIMCPLHQYENCSDIMAEMRNRDYNNQELWMLHSDGETRKVIESNTRRIYSNGALIGVQGVGRDATERIQLERSLERKHRQLSALNDISGSIASSKISMNMNTLFENISKKIVDTINVPLCSIWLLDEGSNIHCMSAEGALGDIINKDPVYISVSEFNHATENLDITSFSDVCRQFILNHNYDNIDPSLINNMLFIPFLLDDKPIGTLAICCTDPIDEGYTDMLISIANNLAFAVEKAELYKKLKQSYLQTIKTLVAAIEAKDTYTQGHSVRVSQYAVKIAGELGLSGEEIEEIEIAGILHDIGKIGISDMILTKPGILEPHEYEIIKEHPAIGCRILQPIGLSESIINATLLHHKRFDLQGYPADIEANELPLSARIICVADAYDAMISYRSYKAPMSSEEAMVELKLHSGTQFCPDIVKAMEGLYHKKLI